MSEPMLKSAWIDATIRECRLYINAIINSHERLDDFAEILRQFKPILEIINREKPCVTDSGEEAANTPDKEGE